MKANIMIHRPCTNPLAMARSDLHHLYLQSSELDWVSKYTHAQNPKSKQLPLRKDRNSLTLLRNLNHNFRAGITHFWFPFWVIFCLACKCKAESPVYLAVFEYLVLYLFFFYMTVATFSCLSYRTNLPVLWCEISLYSKTQLTEKIKFLSHRKFQYFNICFHLLRLHRCSATGRDHSASWEP